MMRRIRVWLSGIVLPGFQGVSLWDSLTFFIREITRQRFALRARSVSFSFLMAGAPFLLFLFTLIPYLPISEKEILDGVHEIVGTLTQNEKFGDTVKSIMHDFFTHRKDALLSFSVFLTLFFSSNGVMGLMSSFDRTHTGFKFRNVWKKRGTALLLTLMLIVVFIGTFALMLTQSLVFEFLNISSYKGLVTLAEYLTLLGILLFVISALYKYGPAVNHRWRLLTPGSLMATFLIVLVTFIFFYVVNNLVNYNQIYGSVGTLIVFLIWLFTAAQILLIGYELNVSIFVRKEQKIAKTLSAHTD